KILSTFKQQYSNFSDSEMYKRLISHMRSKISTDDAVPCRSHFIVEA
uniref:Uncharacterized protein n=1 Tax=Parascaris univalens TaxID=6257 RepID=A0A915BWU9_PARUN